MKYIGGYSILDLTDANVSAQANACYNQDKPVLVYGANGERYFADTITKSGTSIIVTKGGKTITIANDNTITNVGDIQAKQIHHYDFNMEYLKVNGNNLTADYAVLISDKNLNGVKLSELPIGKYVLIAHTTQSGLDNEIPLILKVLENEFDIITNFESEIEITIGDDNVLSVID